MKGEDYKQDLDRIKREIDIREYLTHIGYELDKKRDTSRYRAYTHPNSRDKVYVPIVKKYDNPNYFVNLHDPKDRGTVVDLVMTRQQLDLDGARRILNDYLGNHTPSSEVRIANASRKEHEETNKAYRQQFIAQQISKGESGNNEIYLQKRLLTHDTRNHAAFKDVVRLNEAPDGRFVAFPLKNTDDQVTGLAMKSPTKERFLGKREGVWVSAPTHPDRPVDRVIITEDPVDAMSYHQLRGKQNINTVYVSPAGNPSARQLEVIKGHVAMVNAKSVVLANDNDPAGRKYDQTYQNHLQDNGVPSRLGVIGGLSVSVEKPTFKDWNADLVAQQIYRTRLMDRSNLSPDTLPYPEKIKAPESVDKVIQEGEKKRYSELAGDPSLNQYYVARKVDGRAVEFSLSEVAYINRDRKLAQTLGVDIDQAYVAQQQAKSVNLSVSVQQDTKKLQQEPSGVIKETTGGNEQLSQAAVTQDKIKQGRAALRQTDLHVRSAEPPSISLPASQTTESKPNNDFTSIKEQYDRRLNGLRQEFEGQPGNQTALRRLDYYQRYPHLNGEEVANFVKAEETVKSSQLDKSRTIGKQQEMGH